MKPWKDQQGNVVTFERFIELLSEAILGNLMAFDLAGVPRFQVKQIIGPDGGTLVGAGALFQTPADPPMTDEQGRALLQRYKEVLADYDAGRLSDAKLAEIRERNRTLHKVEVIQKHIGKGNTGQA